MSSKLRIDLVFTETINKAPLSDKFSATLQTCRKARRNIAIGILKFIVRT
jgi:hypothetical protein